MLDLYQFVFYQQIYVRVNCSKIKVSLVNDFGFIGAVLAYIQNPGNYNVLASFHHLRRLDLVAVGPVYYF